MSRALACLIATGLTGLSTTAMALNPNATGTYYYTTYVYDPTGTDPQLETTRSFPIGGSHTQFDQTSLGTTAISSSTDGVRGVGFRISASATAIPDSGAAPGIADRSVAQAETNIIFYITAEGPSNTLIPVDLKALMQSSGSQAPNYAFGLYGIGTGYTELEVYDQITDTPPHDYVYQNCEFEGCPQTTSVDIDQQIDLIAGETYEVQESVFVSAGAYTTTVGTQTATASADPTFEIPYAYHLANPGVSLTISPGMSSLVTVPEPAAWALMIVGAGLCGGMIRRRQRQASGLGTSW